MAIPTRPNPALLNRQQLIREVERLRGQISMVERMVSALQSSLANLLIVLRA